MRRTIPTRITRQKTALARCNMITVPRKMRTNLVKRNRGWEWISTTAQEDDRENKRQRMSDIEASEILNSMRMIEDYPNPPIENVNEIVEANSSTEPVAALTISEQSSHEEDVPVVALTISEQSSHEEAVVSESNPAIAAVIATSVENLQAQELATEKSKNIVLWPGTRGLASPASVAADASASLISAPFAFNHAWESFASNNSSLSDKDFGDPFMRNNSWKRSTTHNIGDLFKDLKTAENPVNIYAREKYPNKLGTSMLVQQPKSTILFPGKDDVPCLTLSVGGTTSTILTPGKDNVPCLTLSIGRSGMQNAQKTGSMMFCNHSQTLTPDEYDFLANKYPSFFTSGPKKVQTHTKSIFDLTELPQVAGVKDRRSWFFSY